MSKKTAEVKPKKNGRPLHNIDEKQLAALMRLKPSLPDTAAFFECDEKTIHSYIRRVHKLTFSQYREQRAVHTRHAIVRKIIEKALGGDNLMLIWASKNLCGWADKQDVDHSSGGKPFALNYKLD